MLFCGYTNEKGHLAAKLGEDGQIFEANSNKIVDISHQVSMLNSPYSLISYMYKQKKKALSLNAI